MTIKLYNNKSEVNVLNKEIEEIIVLDNAHLKEGVSLRNPIFAIQKGNFTIKKNVNYLYCSTFDRYYFIKNIEYGKGGVIHISCACDVLMTFKEAIKKLSCVIARQEKLFNTYLNDTEFMCYNTPLIIQKKFPYGFSDGYCGLLTVVGGGV